MAPPPIPPDRQRPSPIHPLPVVQGPAAAGTFSSPAAMAAWARRYNVAMPPPPHVPAMPGVPRGQFLGPPNSIAPPRSNPYPGYMTPEQMQTQAAQMADMSFNAVLQEAYKQQKMLHANNEAQLAAIRSAYQAAGVDLNSPIAQANLNKAAYEASQSEQDFAGKIVDLVGQKGQAQAGYLSDLQKQQAGLYGDYQSAHKPIIHWNKDGSVLALDPATGQIQKLRGADAVAAGAEKPPKLYGTAATGYFTLVKVGGQWVPQEIKPAVAKTAAGKFGDPYTVKLPNGNKVLAQRGPNGQIHILGGVGKAAAPGAGIMDPLTGTPFTKEKLQSKAEDAQSLIAVAKKKGIPLQVLLDKMENVNIPVEVYQPLVMKAYGIPSNIPANVNRMSVQQLYRVAVLFGYRPDLKKSTSTVAIDGLGKRHTLTPQTVKALGILMNQGGPDAVKAAIKDKTNIDIGDGGTGVVLPGWLSGATITHTSTPGHPVGGMNRNALVSFIRSRLPKADAAAETAATFPANSYPKMVTGGGAVPGFKNLSSAPQADVVHVDIRILTGLQQLSEFLGRPITIISGYRDPNYSAAHGGYSRDPHTRGVAVDAYVGNTPIGDIPGAYEWLQQHGYQSGATPGFYRGNRDPEHVQIPGSGVDKSIRAKQTLGSAEPISLNNNANNRIPRIQQGLAQKWGSKYGVDPTLLLAIAGWETTWGQKGAGRPSQGSFVLGYGVTDSGIISKYRGIETQYRYGAKLLASWGVHTIQDILNGKASAWASDSEWEQGVAGVYSSIAGRAV